jgi:DNA-binding protein H-NS
MASFRWTAQTTEAAELVAKDELTNQEIADKFGVTPQALGKWKAHPEFKARVDEHVEEYRALVRRRGIAQLERRVDALNTRWNLMHRVIAERAVAPIMQGVPGGETGLMVRTVKGVGKGDDFQLIDLYEVDVGLLKELREHEKQAAQELGQWTEKVQSEVRATLVDPDRQAAMLGSERAIDIACDFDAEINRSRDRGADPGGVRDQGE